MDLYDKKRSGVVTPMLYLHLYEQANTLCLKKYTTQPPMIILTIIV